MGGAIEEASSEKTIGDLIDLVMCVCVYICVYVCVLLFFFFFEWFFCLRELGASFGHETLLRFCHSGLRFVKRRDK